MTRITAKGLVSNFSELNQEYFNGELNIPKFEWIKEREIMLHGQYYPIKNIIKINSKFRDNYKVLRFLLYHEMCHHWQCNGLDFENLLIQCKKQHDDTFMSRLKEYKQFEEIYIEYVHFVANWWLKVGYLSKEEIFECLSELSCDKIILQKTTSLD